MKVGVIGIRGFGQRHLEQISLLMEEGIVELHAVCDTSFDKEEEDNFQSRGIRTYLDYRAMLKAESALDFVVIATPLQMHAPMAVEAMKAGKHVLLEKPPAAVIQDTLELIQVSMQTGKHIAVNFTKISQTAMAALTSSMREGQIGEVRQVKAIGHWQRLDHYFNRSPWAGKISINGQYVLDGPISNALSHLLYNAVKLACLPAENGHDPAVPVSVKAELYRAHRIESEDTSCLRAKMSNGVELLYYATLSGAVQKMPYVEIEGTRGKLRWDYGDHGTMRETYLNLMGVIRGEEEKLTCSAADTKSYSLIANAAFESSRKVHSIGESYIRTYPEQDSVATVIQDIEETMESCKGRGILFSEAAIPWGVTTQAFPLDGYERFGVNWGL